MALLNSQEIQKESGTFLTAHATRRMKQRAISQTALDAALRWGTPIEQNGATVFFLGRRHLPADLTPAEAARLEGTVVVVARNGTVITTFRSRRLPTVMRQRYPRRS
jgi:hypothetical protein